MIVFKKLKVWLGWCPNPPPGSRMKTMEYSRAVAGSEEREPITPRIAIDPIVKEELKWI